MALAAALSLAPAALAHPTSAELAAMFARGAYGEAARQAEQAAGADDFAFAARAILAEVMTGSGEPDAAKVQRARQDAEAALRINPNHREGKLQLAIALSLQSRAMGSMDAWMSGNGQTGQRLAKEVLQSDPSNAFAHGFLAVWNLEVRRRGGQVGAGLLGASVAEGRRHYEAASRLDPDYVGVHWQYARALAALDGRRYGDEVIAVLEKAVAVRADDHVESVMQARAQELLRTMRSDRQAGQRLALRLL
jgi:tetratricopeptide (TPR) repeat protein